MSGINVDFGARDNGLLSFFDKIKQEALRYTNSGKEQVRYLNEQVQLLERKNRLELESRRIELDRERSNRLGSLGSDNRRLNEVSRHNRDLLSSGVIDREEYSRRAKKLAPIRDSLTEEGVQSNYEERVKSLKDKEREDRYQTSLLRENVEAIRQTSRQEIIEGQKEAERFVKAVKEDKDAPDEKKIAANVVEEELKRRSKSDGENVFNSLLKVENIRSAFNYAGQMANSKNGFDLITPFTALSGMLGGAAIGGLLEMIPGFGGKGQLGATLGKETGQFGGQILTSKALAVEEYERQLYQNRARSGFGMSSYDMTNVGISGFEYLQLQSQFGKSAGSSIGVDRTTQNAAYLNKGLGLDFSVLESLVELQRSNTSDNRDILKSISGMLSGGMFEGDRTFLEEFIGQRFIPLQSELLKTSTRVSEGTTYSILDTFNKVGGEFSTRDSRSLGNITSIQNALSNPSSDAMKALSFMILRQNNPNAGVSDLLLEQSKGINSPGLLQGTLKYLKEANPGEDSRRIAIQSAFNLSPAAAKTLNDNLDTILNSTLSEKSLQGKLSELGIAGEAIGNTTTLEQLTAANTNALLQTIGEDLKTKFESGIVAIVKALSGARYTIDPETRRITVENATVNMTKTPPGVVNSGTKAAPPKTSSQPSTGSRGKADWR